MGQHWRSKSERRPCNKSTGSGFNNSEQLFGSRELFLEDFEQELGRRVSIMRNFFSDHFQDQILDYIQLDLNGKVHINEVTDWENLNEIIENIFSQLVIKI